MKTAQRPVARSYFGARETVNNKIARVLFILVSALMIKVQDVAAQAPDVTVDGATVASSTATISGTVNPHGLSTGFHVNFGPTTAYGYSGYYAPVFPVGNTPVVVSNKLTGLSPNTTYHCQLVATNGAGSGSSADMSFTTLPSLVPVVTVDGAMSITSSNATISGTVNPNGSDAGYFVQWGTTTAYGASGPGGSLPAQNSPTNVTAPMIGLIANTTYHYRLTATNAEGIGYSGDMTLTTSNAPPPPPPAIAGITISSVTATNATIYGAVNPNGSPTTCYFEWGTTVAYGNVTPFDFLPGQSTPLYTSYQYLTGLTPDTTYHFRLIATNTAGATVGADQQFKTPAQVTIDGHTFTYVVTNGAIMVIAYAGPGGNVTIPNSIAGLPVTSIGNNAFQNVTTVTGVIFPNALASIGESSFYGCYGLTNVVIPNSVTNLGDSAFSFCTSLANLTFGSGITTIRGGLERSMYGTFMGCNLTRLTIPDTVTNISDGPLHLGGALGAFWGNNLTNVIVGKGLAFLGVGTFSYNTGLVAVYFKGNAPTPGENMFGQDLFHYDTVATAYYLPGTTGWGTTYAGIPAVLWNPQTLAANNNFVAGASQFGFNIVGTADIPIVIEACANPGGGSWVPLQSCTLTNGSLYFNDPQSLTLPARVYRIRSP